jgi:PAS domain S-box-containing protein
MRTSGHEQDEVLRSALDFRDRVMAAATFAIAVIDSEGKIALANRAAAEVCGEVEELTGRALSAYIARGDSVRVAEIVQLALAHGLSVSNAECEVLRKDGMTRTVRFSLQPLTLESGERGLVGVAEDVTERKESEAKLRETLAEVERLKSQLQSENLHIEEEVNLSPQRKSAPEPEELRTLEEVERSHITRALVVCNWRIEGTQGAAKRLGLHPSTLRSRIRKLNINRS